LVSVAFAQDVVTAPFEPDNGDLIAVRGDPLSNVSLLQDIDVVVKGGLVFKHSGLK
jgi:hypothetical protein